MELGKLLVAVLSLALVFGAVRSFDFTEEDLASEERLWDLYERWRSQHRVSRDLDEKRQRFNVFKMNVQYIHRVNKMDRPYKLKLNKFGDLTSHEFRCSYSSNIKHFRMLRGSRGCTSFMYEKASNLPPSVDWRRNGAVTVPSDHSIACYLQQLLGVTGSCWAFSAINNEYALKKAVAHQPVSVAIDAGGSDLQFYSEGVFNGHCGTELDHGVAVVGYGTTLDGTKYWIVKNSWGPEWGEHGYIRMQRMVGAEEGLCGIAMEASYPIKLSSNNPQREPFKDEL